MSQTEPNKANSTTEPTPANDPRTAHPFERLYKFRRLAETNLNYEFAADVEVAYMEKSRQEASFSIGPAELELMKEDLETVYQQFISRTSVNLSTDAFYRVLASVNNRLSAYYERLLTQNKPEILPIKTPL